MDDEKGLDELHEEYPDTLYGQMREVNYHLVNLIREVARSLGIFRFLDWLEKRLGM